jgi:hypothetical protein
MNFGEFSPEKLDQLPKVDRKDFRILWDVSYWDGPRTGILSYQGEKYWFQVFDETDDNVIFRRLLILELSDEQLREEEHWHDLFRQKVGTHTDYDEAGKRQSGILHPKEVWHEFYDLYRYRLPLDLTNNRIIGWFEY